MSRGSDPQPAPHAATAPPAEAERRQARAWLASPWPSLVVAGDDTVTEAGEAARALFGSLRPGRPLEALAPGGLALARLADRVRRDGAPVHDAALTLASADPSGPSLLAEVTGAPFEGEAVLLTVRPLDDDRPRLAAEGLSAAAGLGRTLAHEIKNPLAGIRGAAQLLAAGAEGDDRALAQLIVDETERVRRLIDRVEAFSDARAPARRPVNLHAVLDRVRRLVESGAGPAVRFRERYDPSLPDACGDEDQLVQVVLNLVKNAAEAAASPGRTDSAGLGEVTLATAWRQGGRTPLSDGSGWQATPLELRVEDDGPGVDPHLKARLFDPFVTGKPHGEGLGLTLAAKLTADHGGALDFTSEPGRTVFRLLLPAAASARERAVARPPE